MMRWEPFRDLVSLREAMDWAFEDRVVHPYHFHAIFDGDKGLALDVYQTPSDVVVRASLPGVKPEEVEITMTGDVLTIKGEQRMGGEVTEDAYLLQERRYGAFSRSLTLPASLQTDKAEAHFENGVLTLTIPKAEEVRPRQIKVQAEKVIEGKKS